MRLEDYWQLDGAIQRNARFVELLNRLQYDPAFDRKMILSIRRRVLRLLAELETMRKVWDERMEGKSNGS